MLGWLFSKKSIKSGSPCGRRDVPQFQPSGRHSAKTARPIRARVLSKQIIRMVLIKLLERKHRATPGHD